MNHLPCVFAAVFVAALVVSCGEAERSPGQRSSPGSLEPNSRQVFTVTGVVVALDPGGREVRIRHEEIPGYMQAMTMPFDVKDTNELSGLAPGDHVIFRLTVTETEGWIDQVQKTGAEPGSPRSTGPERETEAEPLEIGDAWPAYVLTNQFGEAFSTASLRGRTVALSFIFTRCQYPTFCLRMSNNFAAARDTLKGITNAPANWILLSITMDPGFDTPAVLKRYGETYHYEPANWTFATGSLADISEMGDRFGLIFWREDRGNISHNLRTVVIDPAGRVSKIFDGNNWKPEELVQEILRVSNPANKG